MLLLFAAEVSSNKWLGFILLYAHYSTILHTVLGKESQMYRMYADCVATSHLTHSLSYPDFFFLSIGTEQVPPLASQEYIAKPASNAARGRRVNLTFSSSSVAIRCEKFKYSCVIAMREFTAGV